MCSDHAAQACDGSDCRSLSHWRGRFDAALTLPAVSNGESVSRLRRVSQDGRVGTPRRSRTGRGRKLCGTATILSLPDSRIGEAGSTPAGPLSVTAHIHLSSGRTTTKRGARAQRSAGWRVKRTVAANETSWALLGSRQRDSASTRRPSPHSVICRPAGTRLRLMH